MEEAAGDQDQKHCIEFTFKGGNKEKFLDHFNMLTSELVLNEAKIAEAKASEHENKPNYE